MSEHIVTNGDLTVVDIELAGKQRLISVTREAIEDYLNLLPERAARMTADQRCDFFRAHLPIVIAAAKGKLELSNGFGQALIIRAGEL